MNNYNELSFTPEEVESGMLNDFLEYIQKYNSKSENGYMEVHLLSDGYCQIVQFLDRHFDCGDSQGFYFVDYDQQIMTECNLPDGSTQMCYDKEEAEEVLKDFLKDNPEYEKDSYGHWYNKNECVSIEDLQMEQNENSL